MTDTEQAEADETTAEEPRPDPPQDIGEPGRALWADVVERFELDAPELRLLTEIVRTVDLVEKLDTRLRTEGEIIAGLHGPRAHPAAVEVRQQRIVLARLITALRLPVGSDDDGRTQRRGGVRGFYDIDGGQR
jgi:hypothetical protein